MIRYHGGPCTPIEAALELWNGRHALISYAYPDQIDFVAKHAHSFAMDNGAFTAWESGAEVDWNGYAQWVAEYCQHPGFDHALIPDVIDGTEAANDDLIAWWHSQERYTSGDIGRRRARIECVPVWHMHESIGRLERLMWGYRTVAIGSSGEYSQPGTARWWSRISEAMAVACDKDGRPLCKLWGLRQMDPNIFSHIPYSFVDSSRLARKIGMRDGRYKHLPPKQAALMMAFDADHHKSASRWTGSAGVQEYMEFY
jgi:hypothetical protein